MRASAKRLPEWSAVESVFMDMDGTLLDLHFDNHFWLEHLPLRFGERHGMSAAASLEALTPRFRRALVDRTRAPRSHDDVGLDNGRRRCRWVVKNVQRDRKSVV